MNEGMLQIIYAAGGGLLIGVLVTLLSLRSALGKRAQSRLREGKDQFIAIASHYMLTPISIIQGALTRLQETDSKLTVDERQKLYATLEKGQQRLWILAEQFVLVNQIEDNSLRLKLEAGSPADVIQAAMVSTNVFAKDKGVAVEFKDLTEALREARFDNRRMKQAIIAILDNAIKFSPENGQVAIRLRAEDGVFAIEIEDGGPGMTEEAMRLATQTFARGTSSLTYDHEGIGLGLFTANAIIREHGGELRFDTSKRRGTLVTLKFPNT